MKSILVALICPATMLAQQSAPAVSPSAAANLIPWLLEEKEELRQLPFSEIIFSATGRKVIPIDPQNEVDRRILKEISTALEQVVKRMSAADSPIQNVARINEVS